MASRRALDSEDLSYPLRISKILFDIRATRIRELRAQTPTPSYDQIAVAVGCSTKTVYNILTGKTRAG